MVKKETEQVVGKVEVRYKVLGYGDFLAEAQEMLRNNQNGVCGMQSSADLAVSLLFSRNKVVSQYVRGGETRFVCEI